ncbi:MULTISPECIES: DUF4143 domain-containing protein [unclassified Nocardioides]|uniref:DUF4143 domain-containing protein n=1 Tax=unclassified Nocardioides TaxID=2615069 RepID=UPI0006F83355|nr:MULTISPECIES: DUF4143 domain-containing protein [unclassified Nocardioides]KRA38543.1 hypothetical protein ASD81_07980 [Nocardioides sp. Root614]KRA92503.1 hypothetical protein ASD84_08245 [Nocardioides sp. Root682]
MAADFLARLGSRASVPGEVRSRWGIAEYVDLMAPRDGLERDLQRLARRRARALRRVDPARLLALLAALADPPSAELNKSLLAASSGIPATTLSPYVDVLVALGLVRLVPGCRSPVAKRAIGRPRVVFDDVAVARHLSGVSVEELSDFRGRSRLAPLLEGVVAAELLRQQPGSAVEHRVSHLRERNGLAVDLVVELPDNSVYGIEVRTASSFRPHQFASLEALAARAGSRFRGGIVLNTAPRGHQQRPGMWGLPISCLWEWDQSGTRR